MANHGGSQLEGQEKRQMQREIEEGNKSEGSSDPVEGVPAGCEGAGLSDIKAHITQLSLDPAHCSVRGKGVELAELHQTAAATLTISQVGISDSTVSVVSELKSLYNGSVMKCNVDQSGPGEYRIQYTPTVRGRHELTVSVDGQQVAGSPFPVFVSISPTQLGKPVKVWDNIRDPTGVTVNSDNTVVVVTEDSGIFTLDRNGKRRVLKHFQSNLDEVHGVATDSEDNIYCVDGESNKIMKCDKNGGHVQVYEVQQVAGPGYWGVAVVGDEVMLCECFTKGTIMIYDRELKYKRRIQGGGEEKFINMSSDLHGNIYVTDYDYDCVRVYSKEGVLLRAFNCDETRVKRIDGPYGVCVSGGCVYISNYDGNFVSVFTTSGNYVTSFGGRGEGESDLNHPYGICVDKDGFVYVADYCNNKVQCF